MIAIYFSVVCALFGLLWGSFLNVVILRMPRGMSFVHPRSKCPYCGTQLRWIENIPLGSWLMQRGACRSCAAPISFRYPFNEAMTAILILVAFWTQDSASNLWVFMLRDVVFLSMLICVFWIDADWKLIPDTFSVGGAVYGLLLCFLPDYPIAFSEALWGFGIGFGLFFLLAIGYEKATGRVGLGGGDIKLLGMIGVFLGIPGVLTTLLISSVAGSIYGLVKSKWTQSPNAMIEPIPYGPFLVLGALADYFLRGTEWLTWILPF